MTNKKAAMEMSVGTIVTVVLLMTVLIMGLVMVRNIFSSQNENIDAMDDAVKDQLKDLFAEDDGKKVVTVPSTKRVKMDIGTSNTGFGFSIRNVGDPTSQTIDPDIFDYEVSIPEGDSISCGILSEEAMNLITLGKNRYGIPIPPGALTEDGFFVRYNIPENFPPCHIRYQISIWKNGVIYGIPTDMDVFIEG
ncbi:hypothetical protein ISS08_00035 [Candidatus Pacearchaeota archaeon]|nr:hypothetical protein [Candidatus Pacearchaeota archaeon]